MYLGCTASLGSFNCILVHSKHSRPGHSDSSDDSREWPHALAEVPKSHVISMKITRNCAGGTIPWCKGASSPWRRWSAQRNKVVACALSFQPPRGWDARVVHPFQRIIIIAKNAAWEQCSRWWLMLPVYYSSSHCCGCLVLHPSIVKTLKVGFTALVSVQ